MRLSAEAVLCEIHLPDHSEMIRNGSCVNGGQGGPERGIYQISWYISCTLHNVW